MKQSRLLLFIGIIIAVILIMFLIPLDRTNPPIKNQPIWDSQQTEDFARRLCFDCHSNETDWPWYSYLPPVSFIITNHVNEGREHLNFSEYKKGDGHEVVEEVQEGEMPLQEYLYLHSEADLSEQEMKLFIQGLKTTFGSESGESHEEHDH